MCRDDSYSRYKRISDKPVSSFVNEFHTSESLIKSGHSFPELVIAQKNAKSKSKLSAHLINREMLGIFCYEHIIENDVLSAVNLGIGIILVKTEKYSFSCTQIVEDAKTYTES